MKFEYTIKLWQEKFNQNQEKFNQNQENFNK